jgi:hypothetical protein
LRTADKEGEQEEGKGNESPCPCGEMNSGGKDNSREEK